MKNQFFLITTLCLISTVVCPMAPIELDENSQKILLQYALVQGKKDNYWPEEARVSLRSFRYVPETSEYEAKFDGRFQRLGVANGCWCMLHMCKPRSAFISPETLRTLGVVVPE